MHFEPWQWALAILGGFLVGVTKTGIAGLGTLCAALFAVIMPTKLSSGFVLPLLVFGDVVAVATYRSHARWQYLWRLIPWTAAGVMLGYFAMGRIDDKQAQTLIGAIVCIMVTLHVARRWYTQRRAAQGDLREDEYGAWFAPTMGILAGFTTLIANAAGPLMAIYLLAMRLPKMEYVGTGAVFFLTINLFKVPFMANLGLITTSSFGFNLALAPAVWLGAWLGWKILPKIDQKLFENLALVLAAIAGVKLLF